MKILLTEGAGLTSRQVATQLDALGHDVSAAVSDPLCLARFTRHVGALVPVPDFGPDPLTWFDRMLEAALAAGTEVVFPTQEQVTVLSHQLPRLLDAGLMTAVPPFASLRRVQDKLSARNTLDEVGVPQPHTVVVQSTAELTGWSSFPAFVKAPVGSSSIGVRRVTDHANLYEAVSQFIDAGALFDGGVLVQVAVEGTFVMAQCVFDAGSLVAFHANERRQEGANGSGAAKRSLLVPGLQSDLARLGRALDWHGALSVDAIVTAERAYVIDVNPRLVEPGNARAAGTDLVSALLAVAVGMYVPPLKPSRPNVLTHQVLMAILGAAQRDGRRRSVLVELARRLTHRGVYAGSHEELTPHQGDWRTLLLPLAAAVATLVRPSWWSFFTNGAVSRYALAPEGWRQLRDRAPLAEVSSAPA
ncbi:MAG TPA: ATP-grasp domain-containing protein [Acidimicrobiales bacterium]|jgi:glutathione synthase/RimK-type ligase-like ATP-grasp enzyme|nr:ATP-grasp domain-containing protein [Acidimicrobiales bacterium]